MILGLLELLACQLVGEFLAALLDLPVPGPVLGMLVLLGWLQLRDPSPSSGLVRVSEALLRHLNLLFVPAGTGVVVYLSVIGGAIVPLLFGLALSWAAGLLVAGFTAAGLLAWRRGGSDAAR